MSFFASRERFVASTPLIETAPESARRSPAMIDSVVVFPAPLGRPGRRTSRRAPSGRWRSTARSSPNDFDTLRRLSTGTASGSTSAAGRSAITAVSAASARSGSSVAGTSAAETSVAETSAAETSVAETSVPETSDAGSCVAASSAPWSSVRVRRFRAGCLRLVDAGLVRIEDPLLGTRGVHGGVRRLVDGQLLDTDLGRRGSSPSAASPAGTCGVSRRRVGASVEAVSSASSAGVSALMSSPGGGCAVAG